MHHIHCDKLLRILKRFHPELPISARTSVQTDRNKVQPLAVQPGYYRHFGIKNGLLRLLTQFGGQQITRRLPIYVGINDLKLNKSSTSQFIAIVGFIPLFPDSRPFKIGVYHG